MRLAIADPPYPPQISERYDTAAGMPRLSTRSREATPSRPRDGSSYLSTDRLLWEAL